VCFNLTNSNIAAAITLSSDGLQKPHKKSKKSIENKKDSAVSVQTADAVATNGPETITKSKHQPRKRAADFLSDTEDNAANGASAPAPSKRDAETTEKHKGKKFKKVADISKADSNTPIVRPTFNKDAKVEISKKSKKAAPLPKDHVISPSDAPPMTSFKEQQDPAESGTVTEKVENTLDTPVPPHSKKSKKHKTAKGQASAIAETLTADGVNGVAGKVDDGSLDPLTNKDTTSISMQVEGQMTAEKEIEDEWGSEDEEDDQGAALLKGFDTDGEDNAEDVGLEASKPLPKLSKKTSKKTKQAAQKGRSEVPGTVYVG
jgi:nucleolar protein 15